MCNFVLHLHCSTSSLLKSLVTGARVTGVAVTGVGVTGVGVTSAGVTAGNVIIPGWRLLTSLFKGSDDIDVLF